MAVHDLIPKQYETKNDETWYLLEIRVRRRPSDEAWAVEVDGEQSSGAFTMGEEQKVRGLIDEVLNRLSQHGGG